MRKLLKYALAIFAVVLLLAQFVRPEKVNPPSEPSQALEAQAQVPPRVQKVLARSCYDCHSNQTTWPWYSQVAPASWLVVEDVNHGRKHLNFSTWSTYDNDQRYSLLEEVCEEVTEGKMPLPIYLVMHDGARVSSDEARAICEWTKGEMAKLPVGDGGGGNRRGRDH